MLKCDECGDPPDPSIVEEFGDSTFQERFRECTVDQVVGQQHFAEQNIDSSVDVVTSPTRSEQVAANVDKLSDEEFAQALVPLNYAISQCLGYLKETNDQVSSNERTIEETRCQLDSRVLNKGTKHEWRQLENEFASISNDIQCARDKIVEIKSVLSSVLRQRQCLLDDRAL